MLINQKNNNDGQVPELAKIYKDVHFNPNTNRCIDHKDEATYVCVSFHPYHVCFFFFFQMVGNYSQSARGSLSRS